jgi:hypothetical protein
VTVAQRLRRGVAILTLIAGQGCALNRTADRLGHHFVAGARAELGDTGTRRAIHRLLDSALADARVSYQTELWPTMDTSLHTIGAIGDSLLRASRDTLAAALSGPLSAALDSLVRASLRAAGDEGRDQMGTLSRELRHRLDRELTPSLESAVRVATRAFMHELSDALRTDLREAAEAALTAVVQKGIEAGTKQVQDTPLAKKLLWIGAGLVAAIFALAVAWVVRDRRRGRTALTLVLDEIATRGDVELGAAIATRAAEHRVARYVRPRDASLRR